MKKIETYINRLVELVEQREFAAHKENPDKEVIAEFDKQIKDVKRKMIHPDNGAFFAVFFVLKNQQPVLYNEKHIFQSKEEAERDIEQLNKIHGMLGEKDVSFVIRRVAILETDITNWV